jgi:general secretion pathway protein A
MRYIEYFGMKKEPFSDNIKEKDLLHLPGTLSVKQRVDYILEIGGVMIVTGDVGSGKSTALRWSINQYHRSEINCFYITANSGSTNELYKQLCWAIQLNVKSGSKSLLLREFKGAMKEILKQNKNKTIVIIDEASLLRADVFSELHTINQFNFDSEKMFSLVLVGQNSLLDKLRYRTSAPLASRVMTRAHLAKINGDQMNDYINHHLKISGIKTKIFSKNGVEAIWQGSGGLLRKANLLSQGALIACMIDKEEQVTEEHVRRASTEVF